MFKFVTLLIICVNHPLGTLNSESARKKLNLEHHTDDFVIIMYSFPTLYTVM